MDVAIKWNVDVCTWHTAISICRTTFFLFFFRSLFRLNFRRRTLFPFKWRQIFTVFFSRSQYLCIYMFRLH